MAEFLPFGGLRYNPTKVDLSSVLAPPYDVIKGDMRARLTALSEYNVVGVELPEGQGDAKYENAARLLEAWKAAGILTQDDAAFYVYEQEFLAPGSEVVKRRLGVLGELKLEEFGQGVQPHEHTLSGPKEDRLKLLRATRTNTSPIFGLYADGDGWVDSVISNVRRGAPLATARDSGGVTHRLWRLFDDESINAIVAALEDEPVLIADGHHRYETALNYRNERRAACLAAGGEWTGAEAENAVLMMCVSTSDDGLIVLPTHRLVTGIDPEQRRWLLEGLRRHFEVRPLEVAEDLSGEAAGLLRYINDSDATGPRLGLYLDGSSYGLQLRDGAEHLEAMDDQRSGAYNGLDVTLLHTLILERHLGIGPVELAAGGHVGYTIDALEALGKVEAGDYDAAFLLRSTPVEQVREVAAAGDKMPQKSTYFYPKLVTGMVLRPLH